MCLTLVTCTISRASALKRAIFAIPKTPEAARRKSLNGADEQVH